MLPFAALEEDPEGELPVEPADEPEADPPEVPEDVLLEEPDEEPLDVPLPADEFDTVTDGLTVTPAALTSTVLST